MSICSQVTQRHCRMTVFAHPGHLCASKVDRLWRKEAKDRCMMRCVVPVQRAVQHTTQRCNLRRFVLAGKKNLGTLKVLRMGTTFFLLSNPQKLAPLIVTFASTNTPATFIPNQREREREKKGVCNIFVYI